MSRSSASSTRLKERTAGASALAVLFALTAGAGGAAAQPTDDGWHSSVDVIDHGGVAEDINVRTAAAGTLPDGRDVAYMHSNGNPVSFHVVDLETGDVISSDAIEPKSIGGAFHVLSDGSVYFNVRDGSGVLLMHWDSSTHELEQISENPVGERLIRSLETDDDGVLYGVTYPNSKLFSYDPETGDIRDYGSVVSDDSYAEGLALHDGTAYVGTGMEVGHAIAVDLESGEMSELEPPSAYGNITRFYKFQSVGDLVAMAFSPGLSGGTNVLFWDAVEDEWVCDAAIPSVLSLNAPFSTENDNGQMYVKSEDEIWRFDSNDCSVESTGWAETGLEETGSHRVLSLLPGVTEGPVEDRLVGTNSDGSNWVYTPDTGEEKFIDSELEGVDLTAHSLHVAQDNRVYMGTYLSSGAIGRFDIESGETELLNGPMQADQWLDFGDQLLVGSYGNAVVHAGDPFEEWDWDTNPSEQFRLSTTYNQDRVAEMATDGELVAIGTVSDYGVQGGALTVTDMEDRRSTYRDLVEAQSTASVTFGADGLIYAGTSTRGGLSSKDSPLDAHLVVFDPEEEEVVDEAIPVEDNSVIGGVVAQDNSVWGVTNSAHLFEYDTQKREVLGVHELGTAKTSSPWGSGSTVRLHPENGILYGVSGTDVFAFDPDTKESQVILSDREYKRLDIAGDGTVYVLDTTNLFSFMPGSEEGDDDGGGSEDDDDDREDDDPNGDDDNVGGPDDEADLDNSDETVGGPTEGNISDGEASEGPGGGSMPNTGLEANALMMAGAAMLVLVGGGLYAMKRRNI